MTHDKKGHSVSAADGNYIFEIIAEKTPKGDILEKNSHVLSGTNVQLR